MSKVWLARASYRQILAEAESKYPLETGGVLIGYRAVDDDYVVRHVTGPGPRAIHQPTRFDPDHEWQCAQLDRHYNLEPNARLYLGEWHTHPDASPNMSCLDMSTLRDISTYAAARAPEPLMLIGGGEPGNWQWKCHRRARARARARRGWFRGRLLTSEIVLFGDA